MVGCSAKSCKALTPADGGSFRTVAEMVFADCNCSTGSTEKRKAVEDSICHG